MKVDFDQFAQNYDDVLKNNIGKFGSDITYYAEHKVATLKRHISSQPKTILDFGCGTGRNIPFLKQAFPDAEIWGCDVSSDSLETARQEHPYAQFYHLEDEPPAMQFDLILASCVYHHIPVPERPDSTGEIFRLLSPQGSVFIFEHNPLNPLTRRAVNTCPFDKDAVLLRPREFKTLFRGANLKRIRRHSTLFFPAGLKALAGLEKFMTFVPLGGQYFVQARRND